MRKNIANQTVAALLLDNVTGAEYTDTDNPPEVKVQGDNGSMTAGAGSVSHKGEGEWVYVLTQAETNVNRWSVKFSGTGIIPVLLQGFTISYDPHNTDSLGLSRIVAPPANISSLSITAAGRVDVGKIDGSEYAATQLKRTAESTVSGVIDETAFSSTLTQFESTITEPSPNHFENASIVWGKDTIMHGQRCRIVAYAFIGGRGHFTVTQMTDPPPNGTPFTIV